MSCLRLLGYDISTITLHLWNKNWLLSVKVAGLKLLSIVCIKRERRVDIRESLNQGLKLLAFKL